MLSAHPLTLSSSPQRQRGELMLTDVHWAGTEEREPLCRHNVALENPNAGQPVPLHSEPANLLLSAFPPLKSSCLLAILVRQRLEGL